MGCGASAAPPGRTCYYCGTVYDSFQICEAHELVCGKNPKPAAAPAPAPAAKAPPQAASVGGGGGGNITDFLKGLGIRDVEKATAALKDTGIETRGDFFALDKDMRAELDECLKELGVNLGDRAKLKKAENVGVPVKQGNGEVTVLALQPGQAMQTADTLIRVFLGLGWANKNPSQKIDVDASCIGFNTGDPGEIIYFGNLGNSTKSLKHTGDILSGSEQGKAIADLERIYVWLPNIPATIDCLVFVANIYTTGLDFKDLASAYIRMANADTNQELARMTLAGAGMKGNALVFAKVYRCGPKGPWHFQTLGMPLNIPGCSSVQAVIPELQQNGCAFPPPGAIVAAPGAPAPVPAAGQPTPPGKGSKQSQTPTGVYVAGALAVATVGGIAAATAIFMTSDLSAASFAPSNFETGVDFANLVPTTDSITGIGEGISDGAGDAFDWASGVTESVDFGAIGDTLGSAVGTVGDGLGDAAGAIGGVAGDVMGSDAMGAVGDGLGDAGGAIGGAAGDVMGSDAMGAVGDGLGDAGGAIGGAAGDVMGSDAMGAVGGGLVDAGAAVGGGLGDAGGAIVDAVPGVLAGAAGVAEVVGGAIGSIMNLVDTIGHLGGD